MTEAKLPEGIPVFMAKLYYHGIKFVTLIFVNFYRYT